MTDPRLVAKAKTAQLLQLLRAAPDSEPTRRATEECEYLERAIDTFHMEAIRFRMYTLHRLLDEPTQDLGDGVATLLADITTALGAAGFRTR